MAKQKIGFIGLGLMGTAMVNRLIDQGFGVTVMANRSRANVDAMVARGATEVGTAREVAAASEVVMLCMDTSASVESRMRGADGVMAGMNAGTVVVDFGTSLPSSTKALGVEVANAGGAYLDAPLGRTPAHALDGQLNIMTAGDMDAFETVKPVLEELGENVFHLGALGSGHTIKLINNFFGMTVANAMAEAFAMADVAGVERGAIYEVMSAGPLHSGMMDFVKAYGVDGDPTKLEFAIKNAAKDVGYYSQMAKDAGVSSIIAPGTLSALTSATKQGHGEDMVSQIVDYYAEKFASEQE